MLWTQWDAQSGGEEERRHESPERRHGLRSRRGRVSSPASGPVASRARALSTRVLRSGLSSRSSVCLPKSSLLYTHRGLYSTKRRRIICLRGDIRAHVARTHSEIAPVTVQICAGKLMVTSCAFRRGSPSGLGATRAPRRVVGSTHHTSQAEGTSVSPRHHSARLASTICRAAARLADVARAASVGESRLAAE